MEKAFKMRIYPTEEQKVLIDKSFGCSRYVYNYFLDFKQREYKTYKSLFYGKTLVKIDPFFPSSQLCSTCHFKNKEVKDLKVRVWECPECGAVNDRDANAAINILNEGLRLLESNQ